MIGLLAVALVAPAALDFDDTFVRSGDAGGGTHYEAEYRLGEATHRVEVWRDGDARVRRVTDDAIDTIVVRKPGDDEWTMTVLDRRRRIRTDIDRTNLYRIGHYTDWFAQAHGLARPRGPYRLTALSRGPDRVDPVAPCDWYLLEEGARSTRLCWSAAARAPLAIVDSSDAVVWRVTRLDGAPVDAHDFAIDDRGYLRNDANTDISDD